ncbi:hypothetical protein AB0L13_44810 [Saccharopolyspora shandongensis]|uniref:hypothetical protein n=1 Tax=Saccharopolyspora shandongensis TaxID=418495 RepID=UPI0034386342
MGIKGELDKIRFLRDVGVDSLDVSMIPEVRRRQMAAVDRGAARRCPRHRVTSPGDGAPYGARITGPYAHRTLQGVGHNVPKEAPRRSPGPSLMSTDF